MKKEFKIPDNYNESELFKHFGKYARFVFGTYVISFNGKEFSSDTPNGLFDKVKKEYEKICNKKQHIGLKYT